MKTRILFAAITAFASIPTTYAVTRDPSNHPEFFHNQEDDKTHHARKTIEDNQVQPSEEAPLKTPNDRAPWRR